MDKVNQLQNMDFNILIGGPLSSAIEAQVQASMATTDYIKRVGFEMDFMSKVLSSVENPMQGMVIQLGKPKFVHFQFPKVDPITGKGVYLLFKFLFSLFILTVF